MAARFLILGISVLLVGCVEPTTQKINTISGPRSNLQVTPPENCPDFSKVDGNGGSNFGNTLDSNYGCATVTNYGAMIDDPYDMVVGKHSDLANSAKAGTAISSYEAGTAGSAAPSASSSNASTP